MTRFRIPPGDHWADHAVECPNCGKLVVHETAHLFPADQTDPGGWMCDKQEDHTDERMTPPIKDDTVMFDQTAPRMTEERRAEAEDTLCHHPSSEYLAQYLREALDEIEALRAALRKNAPGLVGRLRDQEGRLHVHKDHTTFDRMYLVDGTWMLDFINAASDAADALEALAPQEGTDETQ